METPYADLHLEKISEIVKTSFPNSLAFGTDASGISIRSESNDEVALIKYYAESDNLVMSYKHNLVNKPENNTSENFKKLEVIRDNIKTNFVSKGLPRILGTSKKIRKFTFANPWKKSYRI